MHGMHLMSIRAYELDSDVMQEVMQDMCLV